MTIPRKVQFNASTLKQSYTAGTSKTQLVKVYSDNDCVNCDANETPLSFDVTLSGITACSGCVQYLSNALSYNNISITGVNALHNLTQVPGTNCDYRKNITNGLSYKEYFATGDCTGSFFDRTSNVTVLLQISGAAYAICVFSGARSLFYATGSFTSGKCTEIYGDSLSNSYNVGSCGNTGCTPGAILGHSGQADISIP